MPMRKTTLVLGASNNPERFSCKAIMSLKREMIPVIAVGRRESSLGDIRIRKGMPSDIKGIHTITLYLSAKFQKEYYDYILSLKPRRIIFNPGTANPELEQIAVKHGIEVVSDCMLVMIGQGRF